MFIEKLIQEHKKKNKKVRKFLKNKLGSFFVKEKMEDFSIQQTNFTKKYEIFAGEQSRYM